MTTQKSTNRAFTLLEVLVTTLIMTIGISGILLLITRSMISTELAWDITEAVTHGEYLFEEMESRPGMNELTGEDWTEWADEKEIMSLPAEKVMVEFGDKNANPLDIHLKVSWRRKDGERQVELTTKMYKKP